MTANVRQARYAGQFFPAEPEKLSAMVDQFLHNSAQVHSPAGKTAAVISPHAGYRFSGQLAAHAFHTARDGEFERIIILSPSHRFTFSGLAVPSQSAYEIPLGNVDVDRETCNQLVQSGLVSVQDAAHDNEHGIETQLPFIHRLWPQASVIPLVVGRTDLRNIVRVLEAIHLQHGEENCLTVVSSDLSHFLKDKAAIQLDATTARMIETFSGQGLSSANACGWLPLAGYLDYARQAGHMPQRLGLNNSASVGSDPSRVVGYGAWQFLHRDEPRIPDALRKTCLQLARRILQYRLDKGSAPKINADKIPAPLSTQMASFVTLNKGESLRGCIGTCLPRQSLIEDIRHNAIAAGFSDHRFRPLAAEELEELTIKIAVLSLPVPMNFSSEDELLEQLRPGVDGLILTSGAKRGVFLPAVWEKLPRPVEFLNNLKVKAGLSRDTWSDRIKIERFTAESFGETSSVVT